MKNIPIPEPPRPESKPIEEEKNIPAPPPPSGERKGVEKPKNIKLMVIIVASIFLVVFLGIFIYLILQNINDKDDEYDIEYKTENSLEIDNGSSSISVGNKQISSGSTIPESADLEEEKNSILDDYDEYDDMDCMINENGYMGRYSAYAEDDYGNCSLRMSFAIYLDKKMPGGEDESVCRIDSDSRYSDHNIYSNISEKVGDSFCFYDSSTQIMEAGSGQIECKIDRKNKTLEYVSPRMKCVINIDTGDVKKEIK